MGSPPLSSPSAGVLLPVVIAFITTGLPMLYQFFTRYDAGKSWRLLKDKLEVHRSLRAQGLSTVVFSVESSICSDVERLTAKNQLSKLKPLLVFIPWLISLIGYLLMYTLAEKSLGTLSLSFFSFFGYAVTSLLGIWLFLLGARRFVEKNSPKILFSFALFQGFCCGYLGLYFASFTQDLHLVHFMGRLLHLM